MCSEDNSIGASSTSVMAVRPMWSGLQFYFMCQKLRTTIDIEDVRLELGIMNNFPQHPNIVILKTTYEEEEHDVHFSMELYMVKRFLALT